MELNKVSSGVPILKKEEFIEKTNVTIIDVLGDLEFKRQDGTLFTSKNNVVVQKPSGDTGQISLPGAGWNLCINQFGGLSEDWLNKTITLHAKVFEDVNETGFEGYSLTCSIPQ